jgi:hypothetical protein
MSSRNPTIASNPREQRGIRIAERHQLKPSGDVWYVPSESSNGKYKVYPYLLTLSCAAGRDGPGPRTGQQASHATAPLGVRQDCALGLAAVGDLG